jgi:hypothetical protein
MPVLARSGYLAVVDQPGGVLCDRGRRLALLLHHRGPIGAGAGHLTGEVRDSAGGEELAQSCHRGDGQVEELPGRRHKALDHAEPFWLWHLPTDAHISRRSGQGQGIHLHRCGPDHLVSFIGDLDGTRDPGQHLLQQLRGGGLAEQVAVYANDLIAGLKAGFSGCTPLVDPFCQPGHERFEGDRNLMALTIALIDHRDGLALQRFDHLS